MALASSGEDDDSLEEYSGYNSENNSSSNRSTASNENRGFGETSKTNLLHSIINRQLYGRFTKHPKAKSERIFNGVYYKCRYKLSHIIPEDAWSHVFMGFSLCGQYFISYTTKMNEDAPPGTLNMFPSIEYELYVWRLVPGQRLQYVSKHRIFKLFRGVTDMDDIIFMQFPLDPYRIICYGRERGSPVMAFLTILTLPSTKSCRNCNNHAAQMNENVMQGWCSKHGFMLHYMFSMAQPTPVAIPSISLAFPDHIVINTGHYLHILNVSIFEPPKTVVLSHKKDTELKIASQINPCNFVDNLSEVSDSLSEHFSTNSVVEAILEDFNEYDLEGNDCSKPFHELNISCEPLNVTGKNYNTLVQNIVDPRLKRLQQKDCIFSVPQTSGLQKPLEKIKVDKKVAEKAYEFTEENEKCEKLSLFRKKRLADKKYEFSEDNSENIVPFYSLRRERRFLYRAQNRCIRSPDLNSGIFLSPRSPGIRSPMQSPTSRCGQFSPGGARNLYCPIIRNSPHHSKSPISPRDSFRKFNVYSPSLDSDCSDSDSRLILRQVNNLATSFLNDSKPSLHHGLLVVDSSKKREDPPKWIKKVVRRYSSVDFENSSLVSGQSRDDYNVPIEIPLVVQTLTEQHLDVIPEVKIDHVLETQLILTQRTLDCDQFVQSRALKLCLESQLQFLHCQDYDISVLHVCPLNGHIICMGIIKIAALKDLETCGKPCFYTSTCLFTWNISSDKFDVIEPPEYLKLQPTLETVDVHPFFEIPLIYHKEVLIMDHLLQTKRSLRDYNNFYEICMDSGRTYYEDHNFDDEYSIASESEYQFID